MCVVVATSDVLIVVVTPPLRRICERVGRKQRLAVRGQEAPDGDKIEMDFSCFREDGTRFDRAGGGCASLKVLGVRNRKAIVCNEINFGAIVGRKRCGYMLRVNRGKEKAGSNIGMLFAAFLEASSPHLSDGLLNRIGNGRYF